MVHWAGRGDTRDTDKCPDCVARSAPILGAPSKCWSGEGGHMILGVWQRWRLGNWLFAARHALGLGLIWWMGGRMPPMKWSEWMPLLYRILLTRSQRFLYIMFLCMDANFRLKNQLISNYSQDPGLGIGWSYMTLHIPYEKYVLSRASDTDVSPLVFQCLRCLKSSHRSVHVLDFRHSHRPIQSFLLAYDTPASTQ